MTAIGALLEHPYAQALSWALVHFVWQGAAIGLAAWLIWRYAGWSARARYATGVAAMALMLIAPVVTVAIVGPRTSPASSAAVLLDKTPAPDVIAARDASPPPVAKPVEPVEPVEPFEPFVLAVWLSGVLVLSARLLGGWFVARRFTTTGIAPVTAEIEQVARRIARDIWPRAIGAPVRVDARRGSGDDRLDEARRPAPGDGALRPVGDRRSRRSSRTSSRTFAGTTTSSISCNPRSKRSCSITPSCGGSRRACARSVRTAATISRCACAIGSSTSVR